MPIPQSDRGVYGRNPLVEVICQLRFPPILAIGANPPVEFQERIRDRFPHYRERRIQGELPPDIPPQIARMLSGALPAPPGVTHEFTADGTRLMIVLANDYLALTSRDYERWEDFWEAFEGTFQALVDIYRPHSITRVGLRYRNLIQRSQVGLDGQPWTELLKSYVLGELGSDDISPDVVGARRELLLTLPDEAGRVMVRHGTETVGPAEEECYAIDSDFFREARTEITDAAGTLDRFHREAGHLFRWCIKRRLHEALDPREVPVDDGDDDRGQG